MHPPFFKIMDEIQVLLGCTCLTATAENFYVDNFIKQSPVASWYVSWCLLYTLHHGLVFLVLQGFTGEGNSKQDCHG